MHSGGTSHEKETQAAEVLATKADLRALRTKLTMKLGPNSLS